MPDTFRDFSLCVANTPNYVELQECEAIVRDAFSHPSEIRDVLMDSIVRYVHVIKGDSIIDFVRTVLLMHFRI